jgi:hypothetical protein
MAVQCEQRASIIGCYLFHYTVQVWGGLEQDPQVFEGLHTLNNITFKYKLLAWVNKVEHHDFYFFHIHNKPKFNTKLLERI